MEQASVPCWSCHGPVEHTDSAVSGFGFGVGSQSRVRLTLAGETQGCKKMGMWGLPRGERSRVSVGEGHSEPCASEGRGVDPRLLARTRRCCGC